MKDVINRLFILLLIVCFLVIYPVNKLHSQVNSSYYIDDMIEQMIADDQAEEKSVENYVDELSYLSQNPLNLNLATKEQLELLPFLTDIQIENILYYLYVYGPMKTIYELQLIENMDRQTIHLLIPFVYVGEEKKISNVPSFNNIFRYGKQEIVTRLDIPLNKKDGYRDYPDSVLTANPNKRYLGSPLYHSFRYGFRYKDQLYWGLTAEKDAGEPFFTGRNKKGYDYYSFYFLAKNLGNLKALAIGNYRLSFGLGLVMNTDYSLGKSSSIATIGYKPTGIKKHSSTDEYNYFRGIAASYQVKKFTLSAFYSHRDLDAIVESGLITSLKKDGMHRILRDYEKKNNASIQLIGSNLTFQSRKLRLGLTAVYNFFNKVFIPEIKPYSIYTLQGQHFYNIGVDYRYRWKNFTFYGETAINQGGGVATLNILRFSPFQGYQLLFMQRYYAKEYSALYARSISESSNVHNENGWYIGMEVLPFKYWKIFAYGDFFRFPWLKYGVDRPSSGFDGLVQATYFPKKNINMFWRYKYKAKDKNYRYEDDNLKVVLPYIQHKFRYQFGYTLQDNLSFRTTIDFTSVCPEGMKSSCGFMLMQALSYSFQQVPLRVDVNYGFFDTDDYASRLNIYERGLLYAFSMPSFYGKGVRMALNLRYDFNRKLTGLVKISRTNYKDRNEIGTGLERIAGNNKTDLYMQLRYKF